LLDYGEKQLSFQHMRADLVLICHDNEEKRSLEIAELARGKAMNNRTVLLVIDAQVNMFAPENPVYASEMLLRTLGSLIVRARSANIPIIYVQNNGGPDDPDQPGMSGWLIHPALAPSEGDVVIQKGTPDAFYQTSLQEELIRRSIKQVVLIGMQTEYCIDTTCRHAFALDYQVTLVKDGHSTYDTKRLPAVDVIAHHNAILTAFATVVEADAIDFSSKFSQES
jgi:nicotinamidase-related amidase